MLAQWVNLVYFDWNYAEGSGIEADACLVDFLFEFLLDPSVFMAFVEGFDDGLRYEDESCGPFWRGAAFG